MPSRRWKNDPNAKRCGASLAPGMTCRRAVKPPKTRCHDHEYVDAPKPERSGAEASLIRRLKAIEDRLVEIERLLRSL